MKKDGREGRQGGAKRGKRHRETCRGDKNVLLEVKRKEQLERKRWIAREERESEKESYGGCNLWRK